MNELDQTVEQIKQIMVERGLTLSTAESCTSGGVAAALTRASGSSKYFQGSIVAYQNELKVKFLGVSQADIDAYDVVSRQVVQQMVKGACAMFGTDYALATTGYAQGGSEKVPSGTIWIAWGSADEVFSECLHLNGGRIDNIHVSIVSIIGKFLTFLKR